jgi:hypothetical protein
MAKTGEQVLVGIKRRITIPQSQPLLLNEDILAIVDDVIKSRLVPVLVSLRQDFFVTTKNETITKDVDSYSIPSRAVGRTLRDLKKVSSSGNKLDITLVGVEDEHFSALSGSPSQFFFKGDKVVLRPIPISTGEILEMWYEIMPSSMTTTDKCGKIINISGNNVSVQQLPTTLKINEKADIVDSTPGHSCKLIDAQMTNITSNVIHFTSLPSTVKVGDYVCPAGFSPYVQLPDECYPYVETESCYRILQSISDYEGAKFLQSDIDVELKNLKMLMEPRISGEGTKIIPRVGLARGARSRWKWGFLR